MDRIKIVKLPSQVVDEEMEVKARAETEGKGEVEVRSLIKKGKKQVNVM